MSDTTAGFERRTGGEHWVPYWEAARSRELRFQRCAACKAWRHPPGPMCPQCLSMQGEWARVSGKATLLSWVVVYPPVLPAWKEKTPFVVVLVQCEEGPRTMGNLLAAGVEDLRMDMAMVVDLAPSLDGDLVPQWRPA